MPGAGCAYPLPFLTARDGAVTGRTEPSRAVRPIAAGRVQMMANRPILARNGR